MPVHIGCKFKDVYISTTTLDTSLDDARYKSRLHSIQVSTMLDTGLVKQNNPNPFREVTEIQYYVPKTAESAQIRYLNMNGKVLKVTDITETGKGIS